MDIAAIRDVAARSIAAKQRFFAERAEIVLQVGHVLSACLRAGGKILVFGNGGSAADAQHLAAELVGRYLVDRRALPAIALVTDPAIITAVGNDLGYEAIFRRLVEAHGRPGDVAIGISTSGRSRNVLAALEWARANGLVTVGLTGGGGGALAGLVDHLIDVPSSETPRIQEVHGLVVHLLCQIVEEELVAK
ncbi:MAG TPA: SIS domain-containing protein [Vicinamibacteria bacterium]